MKVLNEFTFTLTEEEVCEIIFNHMKETHEIPKEEGNTTRTSIKYKEEDDKYVFNVTIHNSNKELKEPYPKSILI